MLQTLRLLSDDPIRVRERDHLGLASWAEVVAGAALGTEGPLTIGVLGRWGVGKTSVLHLAKGMIDGSQEAARQRITTVFFNAWQYEREKAPLVPLVAAILQELESRGRSRNRPLKNLKTALRSVLQGMSVEIGGGIPLLGEASLAFDGEKAMQRYEELRSRWIDEQMKHSLLFNAFKTLRETGGAPPDEHHKVVVFIDDLDRCFPDRAIRLLESIKLVLSEPGFIFVLGVDRSMLDIYLEKRFSQEFGFRDYQRGQSYMAKFIQLPLWIPTHQPRFGGFVDRLLEDSALAKQRPELMPLIREIGLACSYNPRQLIRFLNDLLVDRFILKEEEEFPFRLFVVARGIRLHSEVVYHGLLKLPDLCERLSACKDTNGVRQTLAAELASARKSDFHYDVLLRVQGNEELTALLATDSGREWLESEAKRTLVEDVLTVRELDESAQFQEWIQTGTQRALQKIATTDWDEIMAGCHWLSQFESPLRIQAIPRLVELSSHPDPRIAAQAKRTLVPVCSTASQFPTR